MTATGDGWRSAVPWSDARAVRVEARLQSGAVLPAMFPAPLDGILESAAHRRVLGAGYWAPPETPARELLDERTRDRRAGWRGGRRSRAVSDYDRRSRRPALPLARFSRDAGKQWVWAASCATPVDDSGEDVRWWHARFDSQAAEQVVSRLPANTDIGPYKAWRVPMSVTATRALVWWAAGDPDGIRDLLTDVLAVGKKRAMGEGAVLNWAVEDCGPAATERVMWADDGRVGRPFPSRMHAQLGLADTVDTVAHQLRPPYWRPPQTEIAGGGFVRVSREVIAPWVTRPGEGG